ncbi:MAG: patatin-like phospholipase family protein [Candidatus Eremiobacteraeota bacterium]|nr:patatin-like phospholipase family protein [Candidatus Eremiobacteraeota bacterium]
MELRRSEFLLTLSAAALAPAYQPIDRGLVLSGGGAKGAYEAGVIEALAYGIPDGQPLRPYGGVTGTSIGCLNGWFVATGQYSRMRSLWMNVATEQVFRLKPEFAKIDNPDAGVLNRVYELFHLGFGVDNNVHGLCQTAPALGWVEKYVDASRPAVLPFAWAVTNLTQQTPEYFYRLPPGISGSTRDAVLANFKSALPPGTVVREATDDILHRAIFASACLPVVFDPMELPAPDGNGMNQYCDGGVAANTPLAFARVVAKNVDIVLLTPRYVPSSYANALEIAVGAYDTMQRYMMYAAMRSTFLENGGTRGGRRIAFLRPRSILPVGTTTFSDQALLNAAYELGREDGAHGFTPYTQGAL